VISRLWAIAQEWPELKLVIKLIFWAIGCLATCDREVMAIYIASAYLSFPGDIGYFYLCLWENAHKWPFFSPVLTYRFRAISGIFTSASGGICSNGLFFRRLLWVFSGRAGAFYHPFIADRPAILHISKSICPIDWQLDSLEYAGECRFPLLTTFSLPFFLWGQCVALTEVKLLAISCCQHPIVFFMRSRFLLLKIILAARTVAERKSWTCHHQFSIIYSVKSYCGSTRNG